MSHLLGNILIIASGAMAVFYSFKFGLKEGYELGRCDMIEDIMGHTLKPKSEQEAELLRKYANVYKQAKNEVTK